MLPFSKSDLKSVQNYLAFRGSVVEHDEGEAEEETRRILEAQSPKGVTKFGLANGGPPHADTLPGGAPLIDHLLVRAKASPDWAKLLPIIYRLRLFRCPDVKVLPEVRELTLGRSTSAEIVAVEQFLRERVKETQTRYLVCQLAAGTAAVSVAAGSRDAILAAAPGTSLNLRISKGKEEPSENLPVLLMVGHIGWQIHIRLPVKKVNGSSEHLAVTSGVLQPSLVRLLQELGHLAGLGVMKSLQPFFDVAQALYRKDLWPSNWRAVDIPVLARCAGYNLEDDSLVMLNWIALGTILPGGDASASAAGDGRWHEPWASLPKPLQAYLAGEIAQPAAIAWVLHMCWLLQLFPDVHAVVQVSFLDLGDLIRWWQDQVVLDMIAAPLLTWPNNSNSCWIPQGTRTEMVAKIFSSGPSLSFFTAMNVDWPSVTGGGARFIHTVRSFLVSRIPWLRKVEEKAWPFLTLQRYRFVLFGRKSVEPQPSPRDPVQAEGLCGNPGLLLAKPFSPAFQEQIKLCQTGKIYAHLPS